MLELFADIAAIAVMLLLVLLLVRERYTAPHSEYLRLLEEMPPYDHSDLEREALQAKIDEAQEQLKVLDELVKAGAKRHRRLNRLRHKMTAIRLELLRYEMLKRELKRK